MRLHWHNIKTQGFTLLEVMISMVIFGIIMSTMPIAFISNLRHNQESEIKTAAIAAAQRVLDEYRRQDPLTLPTSGTETYPDLEINGLTFSIITEFCSKPEYCTTINNRHFRVEVSYEEKTKYVVETVFTRLR